MQKQIIRNSLIRNLRKLLPRVNALPTTISWEITHKCNLRCVMCVFYGKNGRIPKFERSIGLQKSIRIIDNISAAYKRDELPYLIFTGGEPLFHKGICEIIRTAHQRGFKIQLISNLSVDDEKLIKDIANIGIHTLMVSIDGVGECHDRIRRCPGLFKRVINNILLFRKHTPPNSETQLILNCVITKHNYNDLTSLVGLAKSMDCAIIFEYPMILDKRTLINQSRYTKIHLGESILTRSYYEPYSGNDVSCIEHNIRAAIRIADELKIPLKIRPKAINVKYTKEYFTDFDMELYKSCIWNSKSCKIDPEGNVIGCINYCFGNLLKTPFDKIFFSKKAKIFRKQISKSLMPGCRRCCLVMPEDS